MRRLAPTSTRTVTLLPYTTHFRSWSATRRTAAVAGGVGLLCCVPPWLQADRTLQFLDSGLGFEGFGINAGRWAVKNAAVIGIPAGIVMIIGIPRILGAVTRWNVSVVVRFALMTMVVSALLFFLLPPTPAHKTEGRCVGKTSVTSCQ